MKNLEIGIIYLNTNLSISTVLNSIDFINEEYFDLEFSYFMIPSKEIEEDFELINNPKLEILDPTKMKLLTEESIV